MPDCMADVSIVTYIPQPSGHDASTSPKVRQGTMSMIRRAAGPCISKDWLPSLAPRLGSSSIHIQSTQSAIVYLCVSPLSPFLEIHPMAILFKKHTFASKVSTEATAAASDLSSSHLTATRRAKPSIFC